MTLALPIQTQAVDTLTTQALSQDRLNKMAAKKTTSEKNLEQIERTAKEFESVFITEMLKPMFEGLEVNKMFGGGKGEEVFKSMMLDEYGKIIAQKGGIGLADNIMAQLLEYQEQTQSR